LIIAATAVGLTSGVFLEPFWASCESDTQKKKCEDSNKLIHI
jgi:hypothetical protein